MGQPARANHPMEPFHTQHVDFAGEQDGGPERELKKCLVDSLRPLGVRAAYLALVSYDQRKGPQSVPPQGSALPPLSVALCLTLEDQAVAKHNIVERAGADFAALFGAGQHMDIIFLTDQQELALERVCRPFFKAMDRIE